MNITIPQSILARELALLAPAAERKTAIPILSNVRIEAGGAGITLTTTDLEHALISRVPCDVKAEGAICLRAKRLLDFVRSLTGESVEIAVGPNNHATVKCGKARARIPGEVGAGFPQLPEFPALSFTMDARLLARTLGRAAFTIGDSEVKGYATTAMLIKVCGGSIRCVAMDGNRLAVVDQEGVGGGGDVSVLISKTAVASYVKLADQGEGGLRVEFAHNDNHIFFRVGERLLISRKIAGRFPDYTRMLPADLVTMQTVTVDRAQLKSTVERVAQFANESKWTRFKFSGGEILISAASTEGGEADEAVPCEGCIDIEVGFNARYISETLGAVSHQRVAILLADAKTAAEIRPMRGAGTEQDPYEVVTDARYVIAPMRI